MGIGPRSARMSASVRTFDAGSAPGGPDRRVLGEEHAGITRAVHEHGAREDELLGLEAFAQTAQQAARALDRDQVVLRALLAEEIIVRGQVHDGGDLRSVMLAKHVQAVANAVVRGDVDGDSHAVGRRRCRRLEIEADDVVESLAQPFHHRRADPPVGTGDQDDVAFGIHDCDLFSRVTPARRPQRLAPPT